MTTKTTITPISATRRLLSISAAATLAAVGLVALSAPAYAADADSMVWVCKYVGTPGVDEVLSPGENPIRVSGNSADEDMDGQVFVGDQFADAQGRSVIVQIEGEDPDADICSTTPPPTASPTASPTDLSDRLSDRQSDGGDDAGHRRTAYGWRGWRRPRRPSRGRCPARRGRPRGGRGGVASPGCHPSVTSTRAGGPPPGRPAPQGPTDRRPSARQKRAPRGAPRRRARPTVGPPARQKRPQVTARPVDGPG